MQLRKEAWKKKFRTSTGFEPVTSRLPVRCSTNWAMKPLTSGAGQLYAGMKWKWRNDRRSERNLCKCIKKPEKKIQDLIIGNSVTARSRVQTPLKSWIFFQASLRNCIYCVHCDDHFFIFISFPQFIYHLFHISVTKKRSVSWPT